MKEKERPTEKEMKSPPGATERDVPTVEVVDSSYQPSKAELEADVSIDATPDEVARAITRTVRTSRVKAPSKRAATGQREKPPERT